MPVRLPCGYPLAHRRYAKNAYILPDDVENPEHQRLPCHPHILHDLIAEEHAHIEAFSGKLGDALPDGDLDFDAP
jgi:hypothetical protein